METIVILVLGCCGILAVLVVGIVGIYLKCFESGMGSGYEQGSGGIRTCSGKEGCTVT